MPNLTSLDAPSYHVANVEGSNLGLRELRLDVDSGQGADFLSQFTTLECLEVRDLGHVPPIASLPRLRRLSLPDFRGGAGALLSALELSPCAGTLEALRFSLLCNAWSWRLELLSSLVNLREFGLDSSAKVISSGDDIDAMAAALADHPTLAALDLKVPEVLTTAVLRRGFPSNLKVLGITSRFYDDFEAFVASLPPNLSALRYEGKGSAADVRALLSRCPQLRVLSVRCGDEAVEYLASGDVDRPLLVNRSWIGGRAYEALTAAGHRVDFFRLYVYWRVAGGLLINGRAVAV